MNDTMDVLIKPGTPCDVCGSMKNVRWWRQTNARVCDSPACYQRHEESWQRGYEELEAQEQHAREMGWNG